MEEKEHKSTRAQERERVRANLRVNRVRITKSEDIINEIAAARSTGARTHLPPLATASAVAEKKAKALAGRHALLVPLDRQQHGFDLWIRERAALHVLDATHRVAQRLGRTQRELHRERERCRVVGAARAGALGDDLRSGMRDESGQEEPRHVRGIGSMIARHTSTHCHLQSHNAPSGRDRHPRRRR